MVLSDKDIREAIKTGDVEISPYVEANLQPASYDLTVGTSVLVRAGLHDLAQERFVRIPRGEFAVIPTQERIRLSTKLCARFGLRSYFARKGLLALSGPQVDPGYNGILTVSVFNVGTSDIVVEKGLPFATIEFSRLATAAEEGYSGMYQNTQDFTSEDVEDITREHMNLMELEKAVRRLDERHSSLETWVTRVYYAFVVSLLGGFVFFFLNLLAKKLGLY